MITFILFSFYHLECDLSNTINEKYKAREDLIAKRSDRSKIEKLDLEIIDLELEVSNHLKKGKSASEALRSAKLELKSKPRYRSPYYWSAFTLFGDRK